MERKCDIIYGGQFGSEGKRLFLEYLLKNKDYDCLISNAAPNSGGYDSKGVKWSALPMRFDGLTLISPGSVINPKDFQREYARNNGPVLIHENACVVDEEDLEVEKSFVRIGSTMRGSTSTVMVKMERDPENDPRVIFGSDLMKLTISNIEWMQRIKEAKHILMFIAQGHSLSVNFGMWPYTTSRNTSPMQGLADAGIPAQMVDQVYGCFRTFPIRVANHYDEGGKMIGYSGPFYPDQKEVSWDSLAIEPEYTSQSKKIRRVATFSMMQMMESIKMNGTTRMYINFMNYLPQDQRNRFIYNIEHFLRTECPWCHVSCLGYGPHLSEIYQYQNYCAGL